MKTVLAVIATAVVCSTTAYAGGTMITGAQIKNGSIGLQDISEPSQNALRGQRGPKGDPGNDGAPGPTGPAGAVGSAGANGANGGFDPAKVTYEVAAQRLRVVARRRATFESAVV